MRDGWASILDIPVDEAGLIADLVCWLLKEPRSLPLYNPPDLAVSSESLLAVLRCLKELKAERAHLGLVAPLADQSQV